MKRSGALVRRTPPRSRRRNTGPTAEVVALVWQRDRGRCAVCASECRGERGFDWSVHHRRARSQGGSRRPWINLPSNLILLCGHGSSLCHGEVESARAWAEERGHIVRDGVRIPSEVPVTHAAHGCHRVFLDDSGGYTVLDGLGATE